MECQRHEKIKNIGLKTVRKKAPKKLKNNSRKRQNPPKNHPKKSQRKPPPKNTKKALSKTAQMQADKAKGKRERKNSGKTR